MRIVLVLFWWASWQLGGWAQTDSLLAGAHTVPNWKYFGSIFTDLGQTCKQPLKWKAREWTTVGAVGAAAVVVMTNDLWLQENITNLSSPQTRWAAKYLFEPVGNYPYMLGSATFLYALGSIQHNDKHKRAGLLAVKSFLVSGVIVQVLKQMGSRARPYHFRGDPNPYYWQGFSIKYSSFPSGHTTAAFSVASVYATVYADVPAVPIVVYSMAGLAGLSRIHDNDHWASDVLVGAALGYSIGRFLVKHNTRQWQVLPIGSAAGPGFYCQYTF